MKMSSFFSVDEYCKRVDVGRQDFERRGDGERSWEKRVSAR